MPPSKVPSSISFTDRFFLLMATCSSNTSATYSWLFTTRAFPNCVDSVLANGYGRVECLPEYVLQAGPGLGQDGANQMSATMSPTSMVMLGMAKRMEVGDSGFTMDMGSSTLVMNSPTQMTESPIVTIIVPTRSGRTLVLHASNTLFPEYHHSSCLTSQLCIVSTETAAYSDQSVYSSERTSFNLQA
jgi:hypothetical protein